MAWNDQRQRRTPAALAIVGGVGLGVGLVGVSATVGQEASTRATTQPTTQSATQATSRKAEPTTVISVAKDSGSFTLFLDALEQADLVETLEGNGPFTLLVPDDEAFEKLPTGTLEELMKEGNKEQLREILLYHVASGRFAAEQITRLKEVETVEGSGITIDVSDGKIKLDGRVEITRTDIVADNGVIHVINGVLMPG